MTRAFADTVDRVARINPRDQWHGAFQAVSTLKLLTTDEVLDEVLAHFSAFGPAGSRGNGREAATRRNRA
jgi:hypothetical protein